MNILIFDIETAPTEAFVWKMWKENVSPSQVIEPGRVICWAAKWYGQKGVEFSSEWQDDAFIHHLHSMMEEADATVTYNGNHFDLPVMNTAFLKLGLTPPPPSKSIDLYQVVRKNFRFTHNRMAAVAEALGLPTKLETGGFELWTSVLNRDEKGQKKMERYNRQDVKVTELLYQRLLPWIHNHPAHGTHGGGLEVCPQCGSSELQKRGTHKTKVSTYQRYQCQSCGTWSRERLAEKRKPEIVSL